MAAKTRYRCSCSFVYSEGDRRRKCPVCGTSRVRKQTPQHQAVMKLPREVFVAANDGYDRCWVCRFLGIEMAGVMQRDHEHKGAGRPRGVLCPFHNRKLGPAYTLELLRAYVAYLERHEGPLTVISGERSEEDEQAA